MTNRVPAVSIGLLIFWMCVSCGCSGQSAQRRRDITVAEIEEARQAARQIRSVARLVRSKKLPPVEFNFNSTELLPLSYETLDLVAEILKKYPRVKLIIEGHACDIGSDEYNHNLSLARAASVKDYLVSQGIYPTYIKARGYGEHRRVTSDTSERARRLDRRVEFIITTRTWGTVY